MIKIQYKTKTVLTKKMDTIYELKNYLNERFKISSEDEIYYLDDTKEKIYIDSNEDLKISYTFKKIQKFFLELEKKEEKEKFILLLKNFKVYIFKIFPKLFEKLKKNFSFETLFCKKCFFYFLNNQKKNTDCLFCKNKEYINISDQMKILLNFLNEEKKIDEKNLFKIFGNFSNMKIDLFKFEEDNQNFFIKDNFSIDNFSNFKSIKNCQISKNDEIFFENTKIEFSENKEDNNYQIFNNYRNSKISYKKNSNEDKKNSNKSFLLEDLNSEISYKKNSNKKKSLNNINIENNYLLEDKKKKKISNKKNFQIENENSKIENNLVESIFFLKEKKDSLFEIPPKIEDLKLKNKQKRFSVPFLNIKKKKNFDLKFKIIEKECKILENGDIEIKLIFGNLNKFDWPKKFEIINKKDNFKFTFEKCVKALKIQDIKFTLKKNKEYNEISFYFFAENENRNFISKSFLINLKEKKNNSFFSLCSFL